MIIVCSQKSGACRPTMLARTVQALAASFAHCALRGSSAESEDDGRMHRYLKTAEREPLASDPEIAKAVAGILTAVEERGEAAVREFSNRFDNWSPKRFTVSDEEIAEAARSIPDELRDYIDRA